MTHEDLMRYLDGEMSPEERREAEAEIARSTELQREVAIYTRLRGDLRTLAGQAVLRRSVWEAVNRRLARPTGWVLLVTGAVLWMVYGSYLYFKSAIDPVEKLATGGVAIGVFLLLGSVVYERYREWLTDPYRDVQR
ncbi:MAG: hypothetical protein D6701_00190 [Gemmatimonadetes bacterium]|nr:MAG: hypothetical protein D6701_00190 [Gemmatimonadota bacterium]